MAGKSVCACHAAKTSMQYAAGSLSSETPGHSPGAPTKFPLGTTGAPI